MEKILNLTINETLSIGLLLLFILIFVIALVVVFLKFFKALKIKKVDSKVLGIEFGSDGFKSPNDSIKLPDSQENEIDPESYSHKFEEHNYFHILNRVINLGAIVECESYVKECFINELLKVYSKSMYSSIILWVNKVIESKGEELSKIVDELAEIESNYVKEAKSLEFQIYYEDKIYKMRGIPDFLLQRFRRKYDPNQHTLMDQLLDIITDNFHPSWESKLVSMLDIMESLYRTNFISLDNTLKSLNGELDEYFQSYISKTSPANRA